MATKNAINSNIPIEVTKGGTGSTSLTNHAVLVGATTSTTSLSVGTNGQVLLGSTGADPVFATLTSSDSSITFTPGAGTLSLQAAAGAGVIVTTYHVADSPATWNKNSATKFMTVYGWAGGSGGGSGRKGLTTAAGGGSGGNAGGAFCISGPASFFSNSETVVIGAGGAGGNAQTTDGTNGNPGTPGNTTSFGNVTAQSGKTSITSNTPTTTVGNGLGGTATSVFTATGAALLENFATSSVPTAGGGTNTTGTSVSGIFSYSASSGGGGGGADSVTQRVGGYGGAIANQDASVIINGGLPGLESTGIAGGNGNPGSTTHGFITGGSGGGGGGGYSVGAGGATTGGKGGDGGFPGGGGGGGGGGLSTIANSGAGGKGGDGLVIVVEFL